MILIIIFGVFLAVAIPAAKKYMDQSNAAKARAAQAKKQSEDASALAKRQREIARREVEFNPHAPGLIRNVAQVQGPPIDYYNLPCGQRYIRFEGEKSPFTVITRPFEAGEFPRSYDERDYYLPERVMLRIRESSCE